MARTMHIWYSKNNPRVPGPGHGGTSIYGADTGQTTFEPFDAFMIALQLRQQGNYVRLWTDIHTNETDIFLSPLTDGETE